MTAGANRPTTAATRLGRARRERAGDQHADEHAAGCRAQGQATVELAIGFPIVVIGVLLVLQLALVGRDQLLVTHATREAGRAAATEPESGAARTGALSASSGLDGDRVQVTDTRTGDRITVTVSYRSETNLPLVGALLPDPVLTATVTVRDEQADQGF